MPHADELEQARRRRRARLEQASSGDVEHALRVLAEVERAERTRLRLVASRGTGADEREPAPRRLDVLEEVRRPRTITATCLAGAIAVGLLGWLVLAAVGYAAYRVTGWLT